MNGKIKALFLTMLLIISIFTILPPNTIADADAKPPELTTVITSEQTIGFGHNTCVNTNIYDNESGIQTVKINITYPDNSYTNLTMNNTQGVAYEYNFTDSWLVGQYNYTIWVKDNANNTNSTTQKSFNISAEAAITISTIKDVYYDNETINLTDPPMPKSTFFPNSQLGYQYLDGDNTLWLWNRYDNYYINTTSGIQLTNHKDNYWSHNVLMLGYYNNDQWNLIYRNDQLTNFTKDVDTDSETYVNITFWKNMEYSGYPFRLAIRYCLGIDETDLTVVPYIKNTGTEDIPYALGFGWELKDIMIDMTEENDYIEIDDTSYHLNTTLDNTYYDLDDAQFYIREDIDTGCSESLYLIWDNTLNYKVTVKSRENQYNAPVTLFIRIGTLTFGQEKSTEILWHDASESTYYFNSDDGKILWSYNPSYMADGSTSTFASTITNGDIQRCDDNSYESGGSGSISKVELRVHGYDNGNTKIKLRPRFNGSTEGSNYEYTPGSIDTWSTWYNITGDENGPGEWIWSDILNLDCTVEAQINSPLTTIYASKIELRVTYTPNNAPTISNPIPSSSSDGVSLSPWLNITVNDADDDNMNISWLTNYSGEWVQFGTNNTVESGTYRQNYTNATENGKWWYWRVNVTDGVNYTLSDVYSFYTGYESKLENTGSTNISGYLWIQVEYYMVAIDEWILVNDTIHDESPRTINTNGYIALDTIFNGVINSSKLFCGNGTYRVNAALRNPDDDILIGSDEATIQGTWQFNVQLGYLKGWYLMMDKGFGKRTNIASRGICIYDDELYVGTENFNKEKIKPRYSTNGFLAGTKITLANNTKKNIEDIEIGDLVKTYNIGNSTNVTANVTQIYEFDSELRPDNYTVINNDLKVSPCHFIFFNGSLDRADNISQNDILVDINCSNVTVTSTSTTDQLVKFYNILIKEEGNVTMDTVNLTYFANDIRVAPLGNIDFLFCEDEVFAYLFPLLATWTNEALLNLRADLSDGFSIWKYNYGDKEWTELVGGDTVGSLNPGFNESDNWAAGKMIVFDGKLYVGTWNSPYNGCQIWRYDGSSWEQVVDDGFGNRHNMAVSSLEVFENETGSTHLYAGTFNFDWGSDGFCQIWRSSDGENWDKVADKGFRSCGATSGVKNAYAWCMEVFDGELYVGTFNIMQGCQLWRTSTGRLDDWSKVPLRDRHTQYFADGFGSSENYGIRRLVNDNDQYLYVGVAANVFQNNNDQEALEIWKYDGGIQYSSWECLCGNGISNPNDYEEDGWDDQFNKYPWTMKFINSELWVGTSNVKQDKLPFNYDSNGCEVYKYGSSVWSPIVEDGEEISNGFGNIFNGGARSMEKYPTTSNNLWVGTFKLKSYLLGYIIPLEEEDGCEVWMRVP